MNIEGLLTELRTDPLARGYPTMTNQALFDSLMTVNRPTEKVSVIGSQVFNAIVPSEFNALTTALQQAVRDVFGLSGDIDVRTGTNARLVLTTAFGAASVTRANIVAGLNKNISRAEEVGCPDLDLGYLSYLRQVNNIHPGHP